MLIVCAWCKSVLGDKPGEGTTHAICPICLEVQNLEKLTKTPAISTERRARLQCISCHIKADVATLILTRGVYICHACLRKHFPEHYRHLHAWVALQKPVPLA